MIQTSEVLNLVFDTIGIVLVFSLYRIGVIHRYTYIFTGFLCVWLSNIFTVMEGFVFPEALNILEHVSYFASGIFFLVGIVDYLKNTGDSQL